MMIRNILILAAVAGLVGCATQEPPAACGADLAIPAEWDDGTPAIPELAGIDWLSLKERNGRYTLADGRVLIDTMPVRPPIPRYPEGAAYLQRGSECYTKFTVETDGQPSNIRITCADPLFNEAAEAAARTVQFKPATLDGRPVVRNNVIYPISFCRRR